jgi:hypothetical protein
MRFAATAFSVNWFFEAWSGGTSRLRFRYSFTRLQGTPVFAVWCAQIIISELMQIQTLPPKSLGTPLARW